MGRVTKSWLRNLAVGLGNAPSTIPVLEALKARREYPSEMVREHVEWALRQHVERQAGNAPLAARSTSANQE